MAWKPLTTWRNSIRSNAIELPALGLPKWYEYSYQKINDIDGIVVLPTNIKRRRRKFLFVGTLVTLVTISIAIWMSRKEVSQKRPPFGMLQRMFEQNLENEWNSTTWNPELPVYKHFVDNEYAPSSGEYEAKDYRLYNPYPDYNSAHYKDGHKGDFVPCLGPRGKRMNESTDDWVHAFYGKPKDFPEPTLGASHVFPLDEDMCFDRIGMIGPYGISHGWDQEMGVRRPGHSPVDWSAIDWANLQTQCIADNAERFDSAPRLRPMDSQYEKQVEDMEKHKIQKRTAVLIRAHEGMKWDDELKRMLRALIMQLSLGTGGEYECFLLYNLHTVQEVPFDQLNATHHKNLTDRLIPAEFRNITVLWNEQLWESQYPKIPDHARLVHYAQWLPIQWFAKKRPEFDFYYNWELDVRYVGHVYDLVSKTAEWAKQQPRKGIWERGSRFYVPGMFNSYENFTKAIHSKYVDKPVSEDKNGFIWGPYKEEGQDYSQPWDPAVPEFNDHWGVGEDADVIVYNPMFEPRTTHYASSHHWWGYDDKLKDTGGPTRRATIVTLMRVSHRLLSIMEYENSELGHHMGSEMWPQSTALHHGLKAVYAPHPMFMTSNWPGEAANHVFNNGDSQTALDTFAELPRTGAGSGGPDSVFSLNREFSLFETTTFYYRAVLSMDFYRRIDGQRVEDFGGPRWESRHGTYCLPPMLLHPIKAFDEPDPRA